MYWFKLKLILNGVQLKNQIKKQADMVLPVSPKVDLGNCPICLTSDVFPRVRRINRTNKQCGKMRCKIKRCSNLEITVAKAIGRLFLTNILYIFILVFNNRHKQSIKTCFWNKIMTQTHIKQNTQAKLDGMITVAKAFSSYIISSCSTVQFQFTHHWTKNNRSTTKIIQIIKQDTIMHL